MINTHLFGIQILSVLNKLETQLFLIFYIYLALGNVYQVALVDNDFSYRAGLLGIYGFLQLGERQLSLLHAQKGSVIQEWSINATEMQPVNGPADLEEPWPIDQQPSQTQSSQQTASSLQSSSKNSENAKAKQTNPKKSKPSNLVALRTSADNNNAKRLFIFYTDHVEAILTRFTEAKQQLASLSPLDECTSDSGLSAGNSLSGSLARQTSVLSNELVTELQSIFDNQQKQFLQQQQQQMLLQQTQMNHQALMHGQRSHGLPANTSSDDLLANLLLPSSPLSGNKLPDNNWSGMQQNVVGVHSMPTAESNNGKQILQLSSNNPFADAFATYSNLQQMDTNKYLNNLNASRDDLDLLDEDSEQEIDSELANSETGGGSGAKWSVGDTFFESSKQSRSNINNKIGPTQRSFTPNYTLDLSDLVAEQQQQEQLHLSAIYSLATPTASAPQPVPQRHAPNLLSQGHPSSLVSAKSRLQTQHSLPPSSLPISHQIPPISSVSLAAGLSPTQSEVGRRDFDWSMFNEQKKSQVPKVKSFDQLVDLDQLVVKKTSSASQLPQAAGEQNAQLANQITGSQSCASFRHFNAQSPPPAPADAWNSDLQSTTNVQLDTAVSHTNPFLTNDFQSSANLHNTLGSNSNIATHSANQLANSNYLMLNSHTASPARNSGNFRQSPLVFEHQKTSVQPTCPLNPASPSFDFEKELSRLNIDFKKRSAPPTTNPPLPTSSNQLPSSYSVGLSASGELGSNSALAAAVSKPLNPFLTGMEQPAINNGQFSSSTTISNNNNGLFDGFTA